MKYPSKRIREIRKLDVTLRSLQEEMDALIVGDVGGQPEGREARSEEVAKAEVGQVFERVLALKREKAALDLAPDVLTCIQCGRDFESTVAHIEFLTAAYLAFNGEKPRPETWLDYGINDAHRIEFCGNCVAGWAIPPREYLETE